MDFTSDSKILKQQPHDPLDLKRLSKKKMFFLFELHIISTSVICEHLPVVWTLHMERCSEVIFMDCTDDSVTFQRSTEFYWGHWPLMELDDFYRVLVSSRIIWYAYLEINLHLACTCSEMRSVRSQYDPEASNVNDLSRPKILYLSFDQK